MSDDIGPNIRQRRRELGLSLDALAKKSGVSSTMLSEVERAVKNPTVKLAYQIARALECTLTELLSEVPQPKVSLVRGQDIRTFVDPESGIERSGYRSELLNRHLEIARYVLPPGRSTDEMAPNRSGLVEHILVLSGRLTVVLSDQRYRLDRGDMVTYGVQSTAYTNEGRVPCSFLLLSDSSRVI